jgi:hypothetical protein
VLKIVSKRFALKLLKSVQWQSIYNQSALKIVIIKTTWFQLSSPGDYVRKDARDPSGKMWNYLPKILIGNVAEMTVFSPFM